MTNGVAILLVVMIMTVIVMMAVVRMPSDVCTRHSIEIRRSVRQPFAAGLANKMKHFYYHSALVVSVGEKPAAMQHSSALSRWSSASLMVCLALISASFMEIFLWFVFTPHEDIQRRWNHRVAMITLAVTCGHGDLCKLKEDFQKYAALIVTETKKPPDKKRNPSNGSVGGEKADVNPIHLLNHILPVHPITF